MTNPALTSMVSAHEKNSFCGESQGLLSAKQWRKVGGRNQSKTGKKDEIASG
jgi:hypothetical protein